VRRILIVCRRHCDLCHGPEGHCIIVVLCSTRGYRIEGSERKTLQLKHNARSLCSRQVAIIKVAFACDITADGTGFSSSPAAGLKE